MTVGAVCAGVDELGSTRDSLALVDVDLNSSATRGRAHVVQRLAATDRRRRGDAAVLAEADPQTAGESGRIGVLHGTLSTNREGRGCWVTSPVPLAVQTAVDYP